MKRQWQILILAFLAALQTGCGQMSRPDNDRNAATMSRVVAAGFLRGDGAHFGPVINNVILSCSNNGEVLVWFEGYRMPDEKLQYVVKVMPVNSSAHASLMSVYFVEYLPTGIRLNVRRENANMNVVDLKTAQFMIEISAIEQGV
jgi:hypothetical protein